MKMAAAIKSPAMLIAAEINSLTRIACAPTLSGWGADNPRHRVPAGYDADVCRRFPFERIALHACAFAVAQNDAGRARDGSVISGLGVLGGECGVGDDVDALGHPVAADTGECADEAREDVAAERGLDIPPAVVNEVPHQAAMTQVCAGPRWRVTVQESPGLPRQLSVGGDALLYIEHAFEAAVDDREL
jgi:hypothetical protein